MAGLIVLQEGEALAVWDDRWRFIYEALGHFSVQRATNVEFDDKSGEWVATHITGGQVIGQGRNRSEVIAQEVAWLEAHGLHDDSRPVANNDISENNHISESIQKGD